MTPVEEAHYLWEAAQAETNFRTVASRSYYACYNRCIAYAVARGFQPLMRGEDHVRLTAFLRDATHHPEAPNLLYRIGAMRLPKLKKFRTLADYNQQLEFTRSSGKEAIDLLDEIIGYMDKVEGKT